MNFIKRSHRITAFIRYKNTASVNPAVLLYFKEKHKNSSSIISKLKCQSQTLNFAELDQLYCTYFKCFKVNEQLELLTTCFDVAPTRAATTNFYQKFFNYVEQGAWSRASWDELIQVVYFLSVMKKRAKPLMISCLYQAESYVDKVDFHYKDMCILMNAAYKTSTLVTRPKLLNLSEEIIFQHWDQLQQNTIWLIMIIKVINASNTKHLYLAEFLKFKFEESSTLDNYNYAGQAHILKLFADNGFYDNNLINNFLIKGEKELKNCLPKLKTMKSVWGEPRGKDISRVLWSLSTLGHKLSKDKIETLYLPYITRQQGPREKEISEIVFVATLLALWKMEYYAEDLISKIISTKTVTKLSGAEETTRYLSRFALLVELFFKQYPDKITTEHVKVKELLSNISIQVPILEKHITNRPGLSQLKIILDGMNTVKNATIDYLVPRFYIAGISCSRNNRIYHFDLLDDYTTLYGNSLPGGDLTFKMYLISQFHPNVQHILVNANCLSKYKINQVFHEPALLHQTSKIS